MKSAANNSPAKLGFEPIAQQRLDKESPPDLKEGYVFGLDRGAEHPLVKSGELHFGSNPWPTIPASFQETSKAYFSSVFALGMHLMRLMALALELPEAYFDSKFSDSNSVVRLLHYPPHPKHAEFNQLGAGAHTDWGILTVLAQDNAGGLEVQLKTGDWIRAMPVEGAFVVNIGDLLARWTNDQYKSTTHRVLNTVSGGHRYSVPMFLDPNIDTLVECLPSCLLAGETMRYRPCAAGEHFKDMYLRSRGIAPIPKSSAETQTVT